MLAIKEKESKESMESILDEEQSIFEEAMDDDSGDDLVKELQKAGLIN